MDFFRSHRARRIMDDPRIIPDEWFTDIDENLFFLFKELDTVIIAESDGTLYDMHFQNEADTMANWIILHDVEVDHDFI